MRLLPISSLPLLALALALGGPAAAATPPAPALPAVALLSECRAAGAAVDRVAVFTARVEVVRPDDRLSVRFELQRRGAGESRWRKLPAEGFGDWLEPASPVRRFEVRKEVRNLAAGARYRAVVRYRWTAPDGTRLARAVRRTRACRQPDLRPDLRPHVVAARHTDDPGVMRYRVMVRNRGRAPAGPSALVLSVDGRPLPAEAVLGVGARDVTVVDVLGPPCHEKLVIRVDAGGAVEEMSEVDNDAVTACPQPGGPAAAPSSRRAGTRR